MLIKVSNLQNYEFYGFFWYIFSSLIHLLKLGGKSDLCKSARFLLLLQMAEIDFNRQKKEFLKILDQSQNQQGQLEDRAQKREELWQTQDLRWQKLLSPHLDHAAGINELPFYSLIKIQNPEVRGLPGSNKSLTLGEEDTGHFQLHSRRTPHSGDKRIPKMKLGCCYQKEGNEFWQLKSKRCSLKYLTFCQCRIIVYNASHKSSNPINGFEYSDPSYCPTARRGLTTLKFSLTDALPLDCEFHEAVKFNQKMRKQRFL